MMSPTSARTQWFTGLVLGLLVVCGCDTAPDQGTVKGRVLYNGKPLKSGTVTFLFADGSKKGSAIGQDGNYKMANIPTGTARIGVKSESRVPPGLQRPGAPGDQPPHQEPVDKIPPIYNTPEASPLNYDVEKGSHNHDIELTSKPWR
jgi:hypothetical protein